MTNYAEQAINDRIEALAWEKAENRAKQASERHGKVRKGLKWVDGVINEGIHKKSEDFIGVCREDAREELEEEAKEQAERMEVEAAQSQQKDRTSRRYIEFLDVAERDGLNRGRGWICSEIDIEAKGAHPSMEGAAVCYVYE